MRRLLVVAAVVVALAVWSIALSSDDTPSGDAPSGAARIVVVGDIGDGDSFRTAGDERIRLIGVDSPEIGEGECHAVEARDELRRMLPRGSEIRLVLDEEELDRFGRTLAYVYRVGDDLFVNLQMVRGGFADQLTIRPNDAHAHDFAAAVEDAREDGLGMWSACAGPP